MWNFIVTLRRALFTVHGDVLVEPYALWAGTPRKYF
jgi:hypothetical protein